MPFLLIGLITLAWSSYSLATGRGYYRGCPPGGFDRDTDPFSFWLPTLILLGIGICMVPIFLGIIPLPTQNPHR